MVILGGVDEILQTIYHEHDEFFAVAMDEETGKVGGDCPLSLPPPSFTPFLHPLLSRHCLGTVLSHVAENANVRAVVVCCKRWTASSGI